MFCSCCGVLFVLFFKRVRPPLPFVSPPRCVLQKRALWGACSGSQASTRGLGRNVLQQLPESSWEFLVVRVAGAQLMAHFFCPQVVFSSQSLQS